MRFRIPLFVSLLVLVSAPLAPAQPPAPVTITARVDPALRALFGFRDKTGRTPLTYMESERFERDGVAPVVLRFHTNMKAPDLAKVARAGVEALTPLASGAFAAKIDSAHLAMLERDPAIASIVVDLPRRAPRPLEASAAETGIAAARRAFRKKDGTLLDGTGVKIADIDSGTFVFHPAFYRADGGTYAWLDVNADGKLTPGVDGVDLDGSGAIEESEVLKLLSSDVPGRTPGFDAGLDYVYVDTNGNGARDYGVGFAEDVPAHGEPIFVVDDVDRDGNIALSEKLLRLSTSKVAAARSSKTFTRGSANGIAAYGNSLLKNARLLQYASHGTGVAGILAAGVPDRSKLLGLAPGADLLVVGYGSNDPDGTTASVQWAIDQKADVILTEYAPYTGFPLDGSSEEETLLSAAVDKGIAVVNPAGNLARGFKHRSAKLVAGNNEIKLQTDKGFDGAPLAMFTLLHRGDPRVLSLKLTSADGTVFDVPAESTTEPIELGKQLLEVVRRTTSRGTHEIHLNLTGWTGTTYGPLPSGKYSVTINADAAVDVELYCGDSNSSWAYGLTFLENTATRTICHPATNDRGIAVAAYTLHATDPFGGGTPGTLAGYSSIGPRIDGNPGMDLAAPDNPMSTGVPDGATDKGVSFRQFGGTSGAGPHVAAAIALLKQLTPTASGESLQNKLLTTARRDGVSSDEARWGKGKLDVTGALGIARREGRAPKVKLVIGEAFIGKPAEVKLEVDDDGGGLLARWDLDYDGKPDTPWEPIGNKTFTADAPSFRDVKVEVLDADGYLAGASARIVFGRAPEQPLTPAADSPGESGGCGCHTAPGPTTSWWLLLAMTPLARRMRNRLRTAASSSPRR